MSLAKQDAVLGVRSSTPSATKGKRKALRSASQSSTGSVVREARRLRIDHMLPPTADAANTSNTQRVETSAGGGSRQDKGMTQRRLTARPSAVGGGIMGIVEMHERLDQVALAHQDVARAIWGLVNAVEEAEAEAEDGEASTDAMTKIAEAVDKLNARIQYVDTTLEGVFPSEAVG